jgi:hypothetical protein
MKTTHCLRLLALVGAMAFLMPALAAFDGQSEGFRTLQIGDPAPDFALPGIDGRTYHLADFAGADVLMVLLASNHCPTSHGIGGRLR